MTKHERNRLGRILYEHMRTRLDAVPLPPWERAPEVTKELWADAAAVVARVVKEADPS